MNLSLRSKIVLIIVAILFVTVGANTLISNYVFTREYADALQSKTFVIGHSLKSRLDKLLGLRIPLENLIGFEKQCQDIVNAYEDIAYAMVVGMDGKILFHNDPSQHGKILTDAATLKAVKSTKDIIQVYSEQGEKYYDAIIPVLDPYGEHVGAVRIGFPTKLITQKTGRLITYSVGVAFVSFGVATTLLVFTLSVWVNKPLMKLLVAIQKVRKKGTDWVKGVEIDSKDEIGQLASTFNQMVSDLKATQEQLIRKERLAVLGQLAGGVGHDLRNPLAAIQNSIYFLHMTHKDTDEKTQKHLTIMEQQITRADEIISNLLDFASVKPPQRTRLNLSQFVHNLLADFPCPSDIELIEHPSSNHSPRVPLDRSQLTQAVLNLLSNAVDAMPDGGKLTVNTQHQDGYAVIAISDTGEGIPQEGFDQIFQPLYTTKAKGIGLGLAIVKSLVEANGGEVSFESQVGEGTTFYVKFEVENQPLTED